LLATYLPVGTRYYGIQPKSRESVFDEFSRGELTWGENEWHTHNVLTLVRPGDPYSVMGFWNEDGGFVAWYANLQDPLQWSPIGYDARDHVLDLIIGEDLSSWMWKDEQELDAAVALGLHSEQEAHEIRRNGEAVIEMIESGQTWWGGWRDFVPDSKWPIPVLAEGWDVV
jgi:hypothetical protein